MAKMIRVMLVLALAVGGVAGLSSASAQQTDVDNEAEVEQNGSSTSGDAVGGQVVGIVSSGDASVDARNRSEDVEVETGAATSQNAASAFAGLVDIENESSDIFQEDVDNEVDIAQTANASSGDGVAGQVIGVVTSAGGSADVVAENTSLDVDVETGVATATNTGDGFAGLVAVFASDTFAEQFDVDNEVGVDQTADASSGDGVAGQVIGVVSAGDASIDARNHSEDVDIETGEAFAENDTFGAEAGLFAIFTTSSTLEQTDVDNEVEVEQTADASSGDGVGGQVIGVVTSAGGSADVVAENTSLDVDVDTGDAFAENHVGGATAGLVAPFASGTTAVQDDVDNEVGIDQTATASSGDGVGGQVIGVVSAGDASIDARNRSEDVDIETGEAFAHNDAFGTFAGLFATTGTATQTDVDNEASIDQTADASSGDAVGGQVVGVVTSAGGSADAVLDNTSLDVDAESGVSTHENFVEGLFVGLESLGALFLR